MKKIAKLLYFKISIIIITIVTCMILQTFAFQNGKDLASVVYLQFKKVFDLPVRPEPSPGHLVPERDPPYSYGPSAYAFIEGQSLFVTDSAEDGSLQILELSWDGRVQRKYSLARANRVDAISIASKWLFAAFLPDLQVGVWEIGGQQEPIKIYHLKDIRGKKVLGVLKLWGLETTCCYALLRLEDDISIVDNLFRIDDMGMFKSISPKASFQNSRRLKGRVYVSNAEHIYITDFDYFRWQEWSIIELNASGDSIQRINFALPKGAKCYGADLIGEDGKGDIYVLLYLDFPEQNTSKRVLCKVSRQGECHFIGLMPVIKRYHLRDLSLQVGSSGMIYLLYPLNPDVPEGALVHFALGRLQGK